MSKALIECHGGSPPTPHASGCGAVNNWSELNFVDVIVVIK